MAISKIGVEATGFADANVGLPIPNISLENRAAEAANGTIFFNTSNNAIEVYANGAWTSVGVSVEAPVFLSLAGNVYRTAATTLTATGQNLDETIQLRVSNTSATVATIAPSSSSIADGEGSLTYVMPASVYNQTSTTSLTCRLYNPTTDTLSASAQSQSKTVEVSRSCKQLLDFGNVTADGVYEITNYGTISATNHYCLQDNTYNGGGWTLLLSMSQGNAHFGGTNNPFLETTGTPSLTALYGLNRGSTFTPTDNDQFLLKRSDTNDWVRFVVGSSGWVAGSNWSATTDGHGDFANGQTYAANGSALSGFTNFNCCNFGGNCGSGGGDGCGFGTYNGWCDNSSVGTAYGFGFPGGSSTGSVPCWGVQATFLTQGAQFMQYFFRKNGTQ